MEVRFRAATLCRANFPSMIISQVDQKVKRYLRQNSNRQLATSAISNKIIKIIEIVLTRQNGTVESRHANDNNHNRQENDCEMFVRRPIGREDANGCFAGELVANRAGFRDV